MHTMFIKLLLGGVYYTSISSGLVQYIKILTTFLVV